MEKDINVDHVESFRHASREKPPVIVPSSMTQDVLQCVHGFRLIGHHGLQRGSNFFPDILLEESIRDLSIYQKLFPKDDVTRYEDGKANTDLDRPFHKKVLASSVRRPDDNAENSERRL